MGLIKEPMGEGFLMEGFMLSHSGSTKPKKFIWGLHLGRLKRDTIKKMPTRVLGVGFLAVALVVFLGAYFWASYRDENAGIPFQGKMVSFHEDIFSICALTGGQSWVVGKCGLILHTNDGGRKWERQRSDTTGALSAVSFANDRVGFVVGAKGIILVTRDGGFSWTMQSSGTENYLLGVQALDETKAYVVGAFGTFLSTSDGGRTWKKFEFPWKKLIPQISGGHGGSLVEPNLNSVRFVTQEIGWVVGEFGLILHTKDGSRTWTPQRSGSDLGQLFAVTSRDERRAWAIGQGGTLLWTKDGGQHWFSMGLKINRDLYGIAVENERMVVVGDRVFLKTESGGSTWTQSDFAENFVFTDVRLMSKGATVVGKDGVIRIVE